MAGLYIHIPFCASRCVYCGFYSTTQSPLKDKYVDSVCREMGLRKNYLPSDEKLTTIYIGGGTPSQLTCEQIERLFHAIGQTFDVSSVKEVTMECNPDDVTEAFAESLRNFPVNRISMGAQTFSDERLQFLRRRHSSEEVYDAVKRLRKVGIGNISIDLMFGFPNEKLDEWEDDIRQALSLNVEHISAYSLMYEEGTPLYRWMKEEKVCEADEETSRRMYEMLIDRLIEAGYEHYEISNFARPGYRSQHNSGYWKAVPYIGVGASAHSYDITSRQWNVDDIGAYIREIEKGIVPCECEDLDLVDRYNDLITTALRRIEGISLFELRQNFGSELEQYLLRNAQKNIILHLLEIVNGRIRLTRKGLFVSDSIMSDLIKV